MKNLTKYPFKVNFGELKKFIWDSIEKIRPEWEGSHIEIVAEDISHEVGQLIEYSNQIVNFPEMHGRIFFVLKEWEVSPQKQISKLTEEILEKVIQMLQNIKKKERTVFESSDNIYIGSICKN